MKKSSLLIILAVFIIPMALYYFFKTPSEDDFSSAKAVAGKATVLEFSSPMCYDCKRIEKEIAPLRTSPAYKNKIVFQKVNVNDQSPYVQQQIATYKIDVVPTLVFLNKNGAIKCKTEGYLTQKEIMENLDRIK